MRIMNILMENARIFLETHSMASALPYCCPKMAIKNRRFLISGKPGRFFQNAGNKQAWNFRCDYANSFEPDCKNVTIGRRRSTDVYVPKLSFDYNQYRIWCSGQHWSFSILISVNPTGPGFNSRYPNIFWDNFLYFYIWRHVYIKNVCSAEDLMLHCMKSITIYLVLTLLFLSSWWSNNLFPRKYKSDQSPQMPI